MYSRSFNEWGWKGWRLGNSGIRDIWLFQQKGFLSNLIFPSLELHPAQSLVEQVLHKGIFQNLLVFCHQMIRKSLKEHEEWRIILFSSRFLTNEKTPPGTSWAARTRKRRILGDWLDILQVDLVDRPSNHPNLFVFLIQMQKI